MHDIHILGAARTPMGGFQGVLSDAKATDLGAAAVKAALERAGISPGKVEQIIMGCVLPAGLGQAPARQAGMGAGLPISTAAGSLSSARKRGTQTRASASTLNSPRARARPR